MPRKKYATDAERVEAIRDYHKKYYAANRQLLAARSKQWRADNKQRQPDLDLPAMVEVAV